MGKGLSPLQKEILAVLENWPSLEQQPPGDSLKGWARPHAIIRGLGRPNTPATRAAVSKALKRLCQRGLVASEYAQMYNPGKSRFYVRIARPST